jgi:DNA-binding ferritin-like protein
MSKVCSSFSYMNFSTAWPRKSRNTSTPSPKERRHWGGTALGTARLAAAASRLSEYPPDIVTGIQHLEVLIARYAALAATTRAAIDGASDLGDADTADLFTEVSRDLDKALWFLESHVQE